MPNWGLTRAQMQGRPWGLSSDLLAPAKTITDPVHGDVYLNRLECLLVDSPPMQRLRRVRQLGTTHLVYPGATHSRFSHALGTLRAAQDLLDAVLNSQINPQSKNLNANLLQEWQEAGVLEREFAKATVLARLGGLMHDLCHVPLGHTIEDDLGVLDPHDGNATRFERLWEGLAEEARDGISKPLYDELRVLIVSKDEHARVFQSAYPFVGDIVGNTICADLIDYIQRDHHSTGLPLALGHRFLDSFFVVRSDHPHFAKRMVINIDRDGRHREDIVTELVKYLRYRYELTERVLTHHAKSAADAMLGKMLELWFDDLVSEPSNPVVPIGSKTIGERNDVGSAKAIVENEFLARSDDGILEHLAAIPEMPSERRAAASALATDLLNRDLYKILGTAGNASDLAVARETWDKFAREPDARKSLERRAADFAQLEHGWHVVVWIPHYKMRLKVADVLIHRDGSVAPLSRVEPTSREIVEQHQRLWAVTVYAPDSVRANRLKSDAVLAYLSDEMALTFHRPDGSVVPGKWELAAHAVQGQLVQENFGLESMPTAGELLKLRPSASTDEVMPFETMQKVLREVWIENRQ